jgi:hypothetical protein
MSRRRYYAVIEITYAGGTLPADAHRALRSALRASIGSLAPDLSVTVSSHQYSVVTVCATLQENSPVAAIARLDTSLQRSLMVTGLFEEFDVTGTVLRIAPLERAERIRGPAPSQHR